jgi:dihydropteroate synthase
LTIAMRLIALSGPDDLRRELERCGVSAEAAGQLADRVFTRLVRISDVPREWTERLADAARGIGCEILSTEGVSGTAEVRDLWLCGTDRTLQQLSLAGSQSGFLPADLAAGLSRLAESLVGPPGFLDGRFCRLHLDRPLIMGVLNVTPDSFYPDSRFPGGESALHRGLQLAAEGADLIDIGGESTRPGASPVSLQEELDRVVPVIERLRRETGCPLSVDTTKSAVARAAVAAGASFVNDISGLQFDAGMVEAVAQSGAGLFLMHTRGRPDRMQEDTAYTDLLGEIVACLRTGLERAQAAGIAVEKVAIDPGIGFGKSAEGNLEILHRLRELHGLGRPVLLGTSRKSFIGRALGQIDPAQRLAGTLATIALGVAAGAQVFRVHDVRQAREAALMAWAICRRQKP